MRYIVLLILAIGMPFQYIASKSFQNQAVVNVEAARETVVEIPYNQSTTLEFDQTVRSVWTSVSSNEFMPKKDKNLMIVSARSETPVTVILADGSVYPLRLIPVHDQKQFAFKINESYGKTPGNSEYSEGSFSGDIILLDSRALEMFQDMYNAYYSYLVGDFDVNRVSKYKIDNRNRRVSIVNNMDIVEIIEMTSEKYIGLVYELQNKGPDTEITDMDMAPFCQSVNRIGGFRYTEGFIIDSYAVPSGQKTGMFVLFRR